MCFNPRPHARGDTRHLRLTPSLSSFNPRPHARGDVKSDQFTRLDLVSIHAPTRGATFFSTSYIKRRMFQSTPPRGGRQDHRLKQFAHCQVSIHAPTRGATKLDVLRGARRVFQSTPPRGGRLPSPLEWRARDLFQSTPPRGGRPLSLAQCGEVLVSIHAPTRGATS